VSPPDGPRLLLFNLRRTLYSILNAFMGEIAAARLAGMMAAKNALVASALAARLSAKGSQLETP
jgi:hypothetical protein